MMKNNISKAQIEVWEWKEKAFLNLISIPEAKRIAAIKKNVKAAKEWIIGKRKENELLTK